MDEYAYFKVILLQQVEDRRNSFLILDNRKSVSDINLFLNKGIIRKTALYEYLFEMKTNLELKMLAHFYGGSQVLFPSPDGTGCIFLDGKDNKEKLENLYQYVPEGIIIGLGHHWLAVQGMEEVKKNKYNFLIHDPKGKKSTYSSDNIQKHFRFYVFQFDAAKRKKMDVVVRRAFRLPARKMQMKLNKEKN
jgi:hypothetical protein